MRDEVRGPGVFSEDLKSHAPYHPHLQGQLAALAMGGVVLDDQLVVVIFVPWRWSPGNFSGKFIEHQIGGPNVGVVIAVVASVARLGCSLSCNVSLHIKAC